jgi:hypothetical protein
LSQAPLCLSFLLPGCHEVSNFALPHPLCHDVLPHERPRNNGARDHGWNQEPKYIFSPLKWFLSGICLSSEKLIVT